MEKLAVVMKERKRKEEYFMVGLFSLSEAIMDSPIEAILSQAHLSQNIIDTLVSGQGKIGELLQIIVNIETANWEEVDFYIEKYKLTMTKVNRCYIDAMKDTNKIMR
jgi:c-di-GMP phosphodiesterase